MATDTFPHASIIGAAVPRIDGPLKTSGTARYAVDHDIPGLVHAVRCRPRSASGAHSQARYFRRRKNAGSASGLSPRQSWRAFTALFPHEEDGTMSEARPLFADDKIYYWGQYVAAVVAETLEQATAAAQAVRVEYDAEQAGCAHRSRRRISRDSDRAAGNAAIPIWLFRPRLSSSTKPTPRQLKPTIRWRCTAPLPCGMATT